MSVNRVIRGALFAIGLVAGLAFFSFGYEAKFERDLRTSHSRFGLASSPWLVVESREEKTAEGASSTRDAKFTLASWSWAALGVSAAAFWARRWFPSPTESDGRGESPQPSLS